MLARLYIVTTAFLLLARTAHTCLVYNGVGNSSYLEATVVNGGKSVCNFNGPVGSDGLFRFTCIAANYAAIANPAGVIQYADPSGSFEFQATQAGQNQWSACEYGCGNNECFSTTLHTGDGIIDYGSLYPGDVVANLSDVCRLGSCDSTPITLTSTYTDGGEPETLTLTVVVNGIFDNENPAVLDGLIAAIQATASNGFTEELKEWTFGDEGRDLYSQSGRANLYKHTSFYGATIADEVSGEQTPWSVTVSVTPSLSSDVDPGACGLITAALGAIIGVWQPEAGAFLGVLSAGCGEVTF